MRTAVGLDAVCEQRVLQRMVNDRQLSVIEGRSKHLRLLYVHPGFSKLLGLALQVTMQLLDGLDQYPKLVENEVGRIVLVCLRVQECASVLSRGHSKDAGD
jgi:hypothetical protein